MFDQTCRNYRQWSVALAAIVWLAPASAFGQVPSDRLLKSLTPTADVNDFAGVLSLAERQELEQKCRHLRETTGAQLAVVVLKSLEGGQIDDFTSKLFTQWGVGEKDKNNGIMLLVAMQDRKARIEVGYGLEPIIPDALAGRILDQHLFPAFKQQRYADGLRNAVDRIVELVVRGEPAPREEGRSGRPPTVLLALFFALFVAAGGFFLGLGIGAQALFFLIFGGLFGGVPALVFGLIAGAWLVLLWFYLPLATASGYIGWHAGSRWRRRSRRTWGSGWTFAGPGSSTITASSWDWAASTSSSSSWSGGDFSSSWGGFGGGSSGGGGASGGW